MSCYETEYSAKERELIAFFGFEDVAKRTSIAAPTIYRMMVEKAFEEAMQGPEVEALRRCVKALNSSTVYRLTPAWDNLISESVPEEQLGKDGRKIAFLIGSIFYYGHLIPGTHNEQKLVDLLRKHGFFFETEDAVLIARREFLCPTCDGEGRVPGTDTIGGWRMKCCDCDGGLLLLP